MKIDLKAMAVIAGLALSPMAAAADGHGSAMPDLVVQPNAELVTIEHLDALNKCDWDRLMAQYPEEVLFILPNGVWIEGRAAVGDIFTGFCKSREEGGLKGATFIAEKVKTVGDTVNVSWRMEADYLAEPYKGGDAYVTRDGLMYVQVTTFDPSEMKFAE
ncbi:MAG: nuclear transport factor 2 family protein [Pseudomonadota bacterium]